MESWRKVFRDGLVPLLSRKALEAIRDALECDSPELCQGDTARPIPETPEAEETPCAACLIGYVGWRGEGLETVGEVEEFFARICFEVDKRLGAESVNWLIIWYDKSPWPVVKAELLPEIRLALTTKE